MSPRRPLNLSRRSAPALRPRLALLASLGLAGALLSAPVQAQSDLVLAPRTASPLTVVAPAFPTAAVAPAAGVRIDLSGTVRIDGSFQPATIEAEGEHPAFVEAVREVLRWWRFEPAVDDAACAPVESLARFTVWFEGSAAAPRVFVSRLPAAPKAEPLPAIEWIRAPKIEYPGRLAGVEGMVKLLYRVSPQGEVSSVVVRSSTPYGAFDQTVLPSARRTRLQWKAPLPQAEVCAQREYLFCVKPAGFAQVPYDGCQATK